MLDRIKIPKGRESGKSKERIESFKKYLLKTMDLWPKNVFDHIKNEDDKQLLISMMNDRKALISGVDMVLAKQEKDVLV